MRLNLGCGRKVLEGWTNVDIVDYGQEVTADLKELPFEDDSADEIMSIHVIEHFYPWEVPVMLKEWRRVLKPGAPIGIECPDLIKVCKHTAGQLRDLQLTMWALYGNPDMHDPYNMHKWGWTPRSLGKMLDFCGYHDIREAEAKYKIGPARDMRMEARG